MILHIGNGKVVRGEEIVGIFDLDNATLQKDSRAYLSAATRAGEVSYADSDIPRAFLVTAERKRKISASITVGAGIAQPCRDRHPDGPYHLRFSVKNGGRTKALPYEKAQSITPVGEDTILPPPTEKGAAEAGLYPTKKENRPRHPARVKREKLTPPAQAVLLSHISSGALHARTERPFDEE